MLISVTIKTPTFRSKSCVVGLPARVGDRRRLLRPRKWSEGESPGLSKLMVDARRGSFDIVAVWRFDRFARSVKQLVTALDEFRALGIDFVSHQEALDTSTPMGKAMFTVIAAMAELERAVIRERVLAGLDYARANGTRSGKAIGRPRAVFRRDHVAELRKDGLSWKQIARRLNVSTGSVRRAYQQFGDSSGACQNPFSEVHA